MWRASSTKVGRAAWQVGKRLFSSTSVPHSTSYSRLAKLGASSFAAATIGTGCYLLKDKLPMYNTVHADTNQPRQETAILDNIPPHLLTKTTLYSTLGFLGLVGGLIFIKACYKKCPSNQILVVYGLVGRESSKCIHGGGTFVIPMVQSCKYISLEPMQIDVNLKAALSKENIRLAAPSFFTVAVGTDEQTMRNAADRILDMDRVALNQQAQDIIFGQMREVIATMTIEEIKGDRLNFVKGVNESVELELRKIGLTLINVNITDIQDESGYLNALGRKAAEGAIQQALIDVSERKKAGEIGVAQNDSERFIGVKLAAQESVIRIARLEQENSIQVAKLDQEQQCFRSASASEIAIKVAEQEKRSKSAIASAQAETAVVQAKARAEQKAREKEEELNWRIAVAKAEALAIASESEANMAIAEAQAKLKVRQAETFRLEQEATAIMKEAQALANVRVAIANGQLVEAEKRAEFEATAKASKAQAILEAEARAEQILIQARAEAEAMLIRLEAEARGKGETLKVKGDGLKRIIDACGNPEAAYKLLMLDHIDQIVEATAKATANIKFDKVVVWDSGNNTTGNFVKGITNIIPPALNLVKDIGGLDIQNMFANLLGSPPKEAKTDAEKQAEEENKGNSLPH